MSLKRIDGDSFDELVCSGAYLLVFTANWSDASQRVLLCIGELCDGFEGKTEFYIADTDENPHLAELFGVTLLPTCVAINSGRETGRLCGITDTEKIRKLTEKTKQG